MIKQAIQAHLASLPKSTSYKTIQSHRSYLENTRVYFDKKNPKEITGIEFASFQKYLNKKGYASGTIEKILTCSRSVLVKAGNKRKFQIKVEHAPPKPPRIITPSEYEAVQAYLNSNHPKMGEFFRFVKLTGVRFFEAQEAEWENLKGEFLKVSGKGGCDRWVYVGEALLGRPRQEGGLIHPRICYSTARNRLIEACKNLDIRLINWHDLRRTYITRALEQGYSVEQVMISVGHKDFKTTRRYLNFSETKLAIRLEL